MFCGDVTSEMPLPSGAIWNTRSCLFSRSAATAISIDLPPTFRPYSTSTLFGRSSPANGLADLAIQPEHDHGARRRLHLVRTNDQTATRVCRVDPDRRIVGIVRHRLGPDGRLDINGRGRIWRECGQDRDQENPNRHQKLNRNASCIWRDVPVPIVRFSPVVTMPKVAGDVSVVPGLPACVRLKMLNASTRTTISFVSANRILLL